MQFDGNQPARVRGSTIAQPIEWSGDGAYLFFSSGQSGSQQISAVDAANGAITLIAQGSSPTVATVRQLQ